MSSQPVTEVGCTACILKRDPPDENPGTSAEQTLILFMCNSIIAQDEKTPLNIPLCKAHDELLNQTKKAIHDTRKIQG